MKAARTANQLLFLPFYPKVGPQNADNESNVLTITTSRNYIRMNRKLMLPDAHVHNSEQSEIILTMRASFRPQSLIEHKVVLHAYTIALFWNLQVTPV